MKELSTLSQLMQELATFGSNLRIVSGSKSVNAAEAEVGAGGQSRRIIVNRAGGKYFPRTQLCTIILQLVRVAVPPQVTSVASRLKHVLIQSLIVAIPRLAVHLNFKKGGS